MKYTIIEVTKWREDGRLIAGDASHEGDGAVDVLLEGERARKLDFGEAEGLPFTCEAKSEEDAIDKYNEQICSNDYLKAEVVEFKEGYEVLVDEGIAVDLPNMLFDLYEKETGNDPVGEEGGHTGDFDVWYVNLCLRAWNAGVDSLKRLVDYINGYASALGVEVDIHF